MFFGFQHTSGIDFASNYRLRLEQVGLQGLGSVDFSFMGTWTQKYITEPVFGEGSYDCAGYFGATCHPWPCWIRRRAARGRGPCRGCSPAGACFSRVLTTWPS